MPRLAAEDIRARALTAERLAETYCLSGDARWSAVWRRVAAQLRRDAARLAA